jgi:DNA repair protein RadC
MDAQTSASSPYTLIRDLPATERPRERLRDYGADSLSASELLAILLRTGSAKENALAQAQRLLRDLGDLQGLREAPFAELCNQPGIGEAKAAQIKAALELGVRMASASHDRPTISSPDQVQALVASEMSLFDQEVVRVLVLDARNKLIDTRDVYRGSVHTAHVRLGELLNPAVRAKGAAIIVVHNHPSGDPAPSNADIELTRKLNDAAKLLDIDFHDHIIIGGGNHFSMREHGSGFGDVT